MIANYDLVILGSGSTAFAAAIRAAELGKTAAMTESRTLGGTCVNRGCLPSKNLIEATRIRWEAAHPRYPGLTPATMPVDFATLIAQKDEVVDQYRSKKYASIVNESDRIRVFEGRAKFIDAHHVRVGDSILEGDRFLVATGSRPHVPDIDGLTSVDYLTSDLLSADETMALREQPDSLIILGGGYIALELGQFFQRLGTPVTLLERSAQLLPRYEPEIGLTLLDLLRDEGMTVVTDATPLEVRQEKGQIKLSLRMAAGIQEIQAQRLLVAAGRRPNNDGIGLEQIGVETTLDGAIRVDDELRTTVNHVYSAGDVIGAETESQMATPVGAHDGGIAAENALTGSHRRVDHSVIPRAIFTDPQIGVVGLTDREAIERGYQCSCNTVPLRVVPKSGATHDTRGVIKMVVDNETRKVLGVSMLGRDASEVIHEAAMALRFGASVHDIIDMIHVYPTMAEALKIVALSFFKDVEKLSCCAE